MHPDVLKRLRAEILDKVGSSRRPTYDDIRDMKFLRAVINGQPQDIHSNLASNADLKSPKCRGS